MAGPNGVTKPLQGALRMWAPAALFLWPVVPTDPPPARARADRIHEPAGDLSAPTLEGHGFFGSEAQRLSRKEVLEELKPRIGDPRVERGTSCRIVFTDEVHVT